MFNDYKQEILQLVNTEGGRFLLSKLGQKPEFPIVDIGKDYFVEDTGEKTKDRKIYRATFYPRVPIKHMFVPILETIKIARDYQKIKNPHEAFLHFSNLEPKPSKYPRIFLATFNPDADPESTSVDGFVMRANVNENWATIRAGVGTSSGDSDGSAYVRIYSRGDTSGNWVQLGRMILLFDTSPLTSSADIISVKMSLYVGNKKDTHEALNLSMVTSTPASNTALVNADYQQLQTTKQANDLTYAGIATSAYNDFSLNSTGLNNISKTSISKFGIRLTKDLADSPTPTWSSGADYSGFVIATADGAGPPRLVVTYTLHSGIFFGSNF